VLPVPLAARVVEVITDLGASADPRYRYGSGCIVRGRAVLTAAHVVAGAASVVVRDPAKREYTAAVDPQFVSDVHSRGPDLALLEIDDPAFERILPPIGLAAVDRDSTSGEPVERCHAVGYPWFAETRSRTAVRDSVDAIGVVPVLSKLAAGLLSVQVTVAPRALPPQEIALGESEWQGMSGAPVFAAGCLLGVVIEHAPREGPSAVTAVPLTALQADPAHEQWGSGVADPAAWWSQLGVGGVGDLQRLPVPLLPRPEPAYWASLREFGRTLHRRMPQLLGRERELAQIAAFATGGEGYRWLVGGAYAGKSALLYEAVTAGLPDEVDLVCYFLSRRASDATSDRFLAAVVPQLAYLCDVDPPIANEDQYRALWEQAAALAVRTGRHLLLVVDGLDEDLLPPRSPSVASLLPVLVGAHAHVLVASRPRPDLPEDVPDGHPLKVTQLADLNPFKGAQRLVELARREIHDLTHGDDAELAVEVLGVLTAAAGPLSLTDLVALRANGQAVPTAVERLHVRRLVGDRAARSLERVGAAGNERYQFAHSSLLEYARANDDLCDPEYRQRIHHWAERWRNAGWPTSTDSATGTPRYLLDHYPATLAADPQRLAALVGDIGWVHASIQDGDVDGVLAQLRTARFAAPENPDVSAMLAVVHGQAQNLRPPQQVQQPEYVLRQLCLQAAELADDRLAENARRRLLRLPDPGPVPLWTTRRTSRALSADVASRPARKVTAVAVLPGGRVVTGWDDGRVLVWDPKSAGAEPMELGSHDRGVKALAALPDGRVVSSGEAVAGGPDRPMKVWDPASARVPRPLGAHDGSVLGLAALPDGRVVSGGDDGRVKVWIRPRRCSWTSAAHKFLVLTVAVLPDGRVVTGNDDGQVLLWDPSSADAEPVVLGRHDGWVLAVTVLPDGRVVSTGHDGRVNSWDPDVSAALPVEIGRHYAGQNAAAVLPDGRVVTGSDDGRVLLWDPSSAGAETIELGRHDGTVSAVAALPDGRVVSGGWDGRVKAWDPAIAGVALGPFGHRDDRVEAVALLPDGRAVTGGADVMVWDLSRAGAAPIELGRHDDWVEAVAVLPDERIVFAGGAFRVMVWDPARAGTAPIELGRHEGRVLAVAVLPDGRVASGGSDWRVLLWDPAVAGAEPIELGRVGSSVSAMAVLPDGRLVSGSEDGRVLVWDAAHPGRSGLELGRHGIWVLALIGLPDGRVVSGDTDGWVLLWDPATPGADPIELGRHDHWVDALAVLPDGRVIAGGGHGQVHLWDLIKRAEITRVACTAVAFATATPDCQLVMAHGGGGISGWFIHVPKRGSCYRREAPAPLGVTGDQSAANEQPE